MRALAILAISLFLVACDDNGDEGGGEEATTEEGATE